MWIERFAHEGLTTMKLLVAVLKRILLLGNVATAAALVALFSVECHFYGEHWMLARRVKQVMFICACASVILAVISVFLVRAVGGGGPVEMMSKKRRAYISLATGLIVYFCVTQSFGIDGNPWK